MPVPVSSFADILYRSTIAIRAAECSQEAGDPFFTLNSFYSWLVIYVVVQGIDGVRSGIHFYDPVKHELRLISSTTEHAAVVDAIQGQHWIGGGGFCVFVCAQWERYMWIYRHSRAYINLLIQIGEFNQELLSAASQHGLGGWVTPAVKESKVGELLKLDSDITPMAFVKLGSPQ